MVQHRYVFKLAIMKGIANRGQKNPYTGEMFLHKFQKCGAFIAPLPVEKKEDTIKKFTAPLGVDSKFLHCAFANLCIIRNS
jgi:hypothetical protein